MKTTLHKRTVDSCKHNFILLEDAGWVGRATNTRVGQVEDGTSSSQPALACFTFTTFCRAKPELGEVLTHTAQKLCQPVSLFPPDIFKMGYKKQVPTTPTARLVLPLTSPVDQLKQFKQKH